VSISAEYFPPQKPSADFDAIRQISLSSNWSTATVLPSSNLFIDLSHRQLHSLLKCPEIPRSNGRQGKADYVSAAAALPPPHPQAGKGSRLQPPQFLF
jgi:hypothetical protein